MNDQKGSDRRRVGHRDRRPDRGRRPRAQFEALEDRRLLAMSSPFGFLTGPTPGEPLQVALNYLAEHGQDWGVAAEDLNRLRVTDLYTDPTGAQTTHIYLRQSLNGLDVAGAELVVNVTPRGEIINVGGGFVPGLAGQDAGQPPAPTLSAADAVKAAAAALGLTPTDEPVVVQAGAGVEQATVLQAPGVSLDEVPALLRYVATPGGGVSYTWGLILRTPDGDHWYDASIDAATGELVQAIDWVNNFDEAYNVYALPIRSPDWGPRSIVQDPADPLASPYGWLDTNGAAGAESTLTTGNNANAYDDSGNNNAPGFQPDGGPTHNFDFPLDLSQAPDTYRAAAVTNLFYWTNVVHDITYHYGFTEVAGNFQVNNYGKGGSGGDAVQAEAQDGSGTNNANFATPPDGLQPRMQMYVFTLTNPNRDGDLDPEIIIHEYGHGISNRLTGGPANAGALNALQSGGMGEGWSDWWATWMTQLPSDTASTPRPTGTYVLGQPVSGGGVRRYPYSFDMTIDPLTFNDFNGGFPNNEVHNAGEIWCSVLWDMTWLLINKHGYNPDLYAGYTGPDTAGNILAMQLVMDALKLQPANPSFIDARDAILLADRALTGGENQPEIWTAFARRGLGLSASTSDADSDTLITAVDLPVFMTVQPKTVTGAVENQPLVDVSLATLTDPQTTGLPSEYVVRIDWGDSTPATVANLVRSGPTTFDVRGTHEYREGGDYTLRITANKVGGISVSTTTTLPVASIPLDGAGVSIVLDEGVPFTGTVATFTDPDPDPSDETSYTALIDWGDGAVTAGTIATQGGNAFVVGGSHVYGGGDYPIRVTVRNVLGGTPTVLSGSASVTDSLLTVTPVDGTATEGLAYTGTVATFVDRDPRSLPPSYYTALIDWGDGPYPSTDVNRPIPDAGAPLVSTLTINKGAFTIADLDLRLDISIDRASDLTATLIAPDGTRVLLFDRVGGAGKNFSDTVFDDAAPLSIRDGAAPFTGSFRPQQSLASLNGKALTGTWRLELVDASSGFTGRLNSWSLVPRDLGTITADTVNGGFTVRGNHIFTVGTLPVSVEIRDGDISRVDATATVTVQNAPILPSPFNIRATEGLEFSGIVAAFRDTNPFSQASDFTATIQWGDGTQSAGRVSPDGTGQFLVTGRHAYRSASLTQPGGMYQVTVELFEPAANATVTAVSPAVVANAQIAGTGLTFDVVEGTAEAVLVATIRDANALAQASDFSAVIDWGDLTTSQASVERLDTDPAGVFRIMGTKVYPAAGTYPVQVALTDSGGQTIQILAQARVADAPLVIAPAALSLVEKASSGNVLVATFRDPNPFTNLSQFQATIAWGDGASSPGTIQLDGTGGYRVFAEHTYAHPGTFTLTVTVDSTGGRINTASAPVTVADRLTPIGGVLLPSSDTGISSSDGVTSQRQPSYQGTAEPNSAIKLYVVPSQGGPAVLAGTGHSDAAGNWTITSDVALADGSYQVLAQALDENSRPNSDLTPIGTGPLVIDTSGPRVASAILTSRKGDFRITFADDGSGVAPAAVLNPGNYLLGTPSRTASLGQPVSLSLDPNDPRTVQARFNTRRTRGNVVLTISATGITDAAGNALVETTFVPFPGTSPAPGTPYVAQFNLNRPGNPVLFAPPPEVEAARTFGRFLNIRAARLRRR
jgi:extracellular elastinolytic metalloproteinase